MRCCRVPGNTPIQPDVKTIQLTREFPYLPSESERRLSPVLSLSHSLSVCLSLSLSLSSIFSLPLAFIPSMESRASQNTHCNRCARYVFLLLCQRNNLGQTKTRTQPQHIYRERYLCVCVRKITMQKKIRWKGS